MTEAPQFLPLQEAAVGAATASARPEGVDSPMRPARQLLAAQGDAHVPEVGPQCQRANQTVLNYAQSCNKIELNIYIN